MGFIQAPSYIPEKPYDMWGGIADIFGDIAIMKERARQRERQRIADAQRAAAHGSQQRGRSLINQKRDLELREKQREFDALLTPEQRTRKQLTAEGYADYGTRNRPFLTEPYGQGGGMFPVKAPPTVGERTKAKIDLSGGMTYAESTNFKRTVETFIKIESAKRDELKDTQDLRAATAKANEAVRIAALNSQLQPSVIRKALAIADKAVSKAESAAINVGYYQTRADKEALGFEQDQTTASALNRQRRLEDVASGVHKFPLKTLATEEFDAGPNYRKPTLGEQDSARQELTRKGYTDQYKPLQREALGFADAIIGKYKPDPKTAPGSTLAKDRATLASIVDDAINAKREKALEGFDILEGTFGFEGDFARKSINDLERTDILSNLMTYADQLRISGKERGSTLDIARRIIEKIGLPIKSIGQNRSGNLNYEDYVPLTKNEISNKYNPETEQQLRERLTNQVRSKFPNSTPTQIEATVNARIQQLGG